MKEKYWAAPTNASPNEARGLPSDVVHVAVSGGVDGNLLLVSHALPVPRRPAMRGLNGLEAESSRTRPRKRLAPTRFRAASRNATPSLWWRALFQAGEVDHKAVANVALDRTLVSLVDLLDGDHLHVGGQPMLGAEIEHFLRFADSPNH